MTRKHLFKAGVYYIGDACYAVKNGNWLSLLQETGYLAGNFEYTEHPEDTDGYDDGIFTYNGQRCFSANALDGDGKYYDNKGRRYLVDSGLLAIMPWKCCDGDSMNGGQKVKFKNNFYVWEDSGCFSFGDIYIQTNDDADDEYDYDDEEEDDE